MVGDSGGCGDHDSMDGRVMIENIEKTLLYFKIKMMKNDSNMFS